MEVIATDIPDVKVVVPDVFRDARGYFAETYNAERYAKAGIVSTLMALTPVLIIVPYAIIHKQKISVKEVIGTLITMVGVALFFLV